jgi:hypothetical protein
MTGREFLELMASTVTVSAAGAARDKYGTPTWSTADDTTYRARVSRQRHQVYSPTGDALTADAIVWLASTTLLSTGHKVTLPGGAVLPILHIEAHADEAGWHHHKLFLGHRMGRNA